MSGTISHRVCAFGCYIVCALLFQRFLENDHHVGAHAGLLGGNARTISAGAVQCSATVHFSRNVLLILQRETSRWLQTEDRGTAKLPSSNLLFQLSHAIRPPVSVRAEQCSTGLLTA